MQFSGRMLLCEASVLISYVVSLLLESRSKGSTPRPEFIL
jgi:hypothetical protein